MTDEVVIVKLASPEDAKRIPLGGVVAQVWSAVGEISIVCPRFVDTDEQERIWSRGWVYR